VLTHDGRTVSWGELEACANRKARLFTSLGVKVGDFVTIALPNGNEFYETTFAVWKLGATPNPVPSKLPRAEFSAIIDLVKPSLVVGGEEQAVIGYNRLPAGVDTSGFSSEPGDEPLALSWKAMTSGGSTGRPKVIVDRSPAAWDPQTYVLQQQADEVVLNPGPLYHNAPFTLTYLSLIFGAHVVGMRRFDPLEIAPYRRMMPDTGPEYFLAGEVHDVAPAQIVGAAQMLPKLFFAEITEEDNFPGRIGPRDVRQLVQRNGAGLKRVVKRGMKFDCPEDVTAATAKFLRQANPLPAFIDECCEQYPTARCWLDEFYKAYGEWAKSGGITMVQQKSKVKDNLDRLKFNVKERGNKGVLIIGLRLKTAFEQDD
jgi:hypothetical protein